MSRGCLPQMNICQGCAKPKLPKDVHKLLKEKKQPANLKQKPLLLSRANKLNFYIFIARRQESVVAKIFRTVLHVLKTQYNSLCTHSAIGAQTAKAWRVSGCARRNPATQHSAFWRALHSSKTQRICCEGKQECDWRSWPRGQQLAEVFGLVCCTFHTPYVTAHVVVHSYCTDA